MSHYLWARLSKAAEYYTDNSDDSIGRLVEAIKTGAVRVRCANSLEIVPASIMRSYVELWNKVHPGDPSLNWPFGCELPFDLDLRIADVKRVEGQTVSTRRRGRTRGSGMHQQRDRRLTHEMNKLVSAGLSVAAAAKVVAPAAGGNSRYAACKRLERAYRREFS